MEFDVSWENSWKTKINHDAIWITLKLHNPSLTPTDKRLCKISSSGLNPDGSSTGSNETLEFYVPSDRSGAFLRPSSYGTYPTVSSTNAQLIIDYSSCGFSSTDKVYVSAHGIEMVYIPKGTFYVGDYNTSTATLNQGVSDSDPWYISNDAAISVANPTANGYRYVSAGNAGEDNTGTSFTIPDTFPNGYGAFYAMRYEITEGQWVDFVNSLPSTAARASRDLTDGVHKNTDTVKFRNTISCSGSPLICSTQCPHRTLNYLNWMDLLAFLDWHALRPMTELEFEKVARGPLLSLEGGFVWGTTNIIAATVISSGEEEGSETVTNSGANVHYNNVTLTGGDSVNGLDYGQGPLRSGIFATISSDRETSGAGYYGVMDLSGNVREHLVTIGNATGRGFQGTHGDGVLSTDLGYEGNATNPDWPGIDPITSRGVTGAMGSGFRGGGWSDQLSGARLRVSDRNEAANASTASDSNTGGRGVRSYDEN